MAEFLELLQELNGQVANTRNLFNSSDGTSVRSRKRNTPRYKKNLAEAIKFVTEVLDGRKPVYMLQEVMSTDDFPQYFGDILDRTLLSKYEEWPVSWEAYAKRVIVNDFRDAKVIPPIYGADGPLDIVEEGDQYPDAALVEQTPFTWRVRKYGRRVPFTWETIINDDLNQLKDVPEALARASRRTEHRLITNLFVGPSGPDAALYTVANKNIINTTNGAATTNPALSVTGLEDAYTVLSKMVDESGEPILRSMVTLVVPPALEIRAKNILNAVQIETTQARLGGNPSVSDSGENRLIINNWMRNSLRLVVDPYIPLIATSANGNTSWFLFSNPNESREAIRIGFLRGHETPEVWMKSPNAVRVGGGDVGPMSGDFDTDAIEYRVRHVTGGSLVDGKATVASNGSGS